MQKYHLKVQINNFFFKKNLIFFIFMQTIFKNKIKLNYKNSVEKKFINLKSPFHYKLVKNHIYFHNIYLNAYFISNLKFIKITNLFNTIGAITMVKINKNYKFKTNYLKN